LETFELDRKAEYKAPDAILVSSCPREPGQSVDQPTAYAHFLAAFSLQTAGEFLAMLEPPSRQVEAAALLAKQHQRAVLAEDQALDEHLKALLVHRPSAPASGIQSHKRSHHLSGFAAAPSCILLRMSASGQPVSSARVDASFSRRRVRSAK